MASLPGPIQRFVDATNRGDTEAFLACFTPNATLSDWGRQFHGRDGIASWNETDNIGVKARMEVLRAKSTARGHEVTVKVASGNFNGEGLIVFALEGDHIALVAIE